MAIDRARRRQPLPRVIVRRTTRLRERVVSGSTPPRVAIEHATIDVMARKIAADDVAGAFVTLAEVCHSRRTTAGALRTTLADRTRVAGRAVLDGRAFHDNAQGRDADARRDLAEVVASQITTVRVTYGMVFSDPCWTAAMIGRLLQKNGWTGSLSRCVRCPA